MGSVVFNPIIFQLFNSAQLVVKYSAQPPPTDFAILKCHSFEASLWILFAGPAFDFCLNAICKFATPSRKTLNFLVLTGVGESRGDCGSKSVQDFRFIFKKTRSAYVSALPLT